MVCETFSIGPCEAHAELGGRPMFPRARRKLTWDVREAMWAIRLRRESKVKGGSKGWSGADQEFFTLLLKAGGFEQPPIEGMPHGNAD